MEGLWEHVYDNGQWFWMLPSVTILMGLFEGCLFLWFIHPLEERYQDFLARPRFTIMNPEYTKTLPDYQTESGCADIMMHTMERYFTNGGNMELTDALAEGLLRTVMKNAIILHKDPCNYEARAEVMWAGSNCVISISTASLSTQSLPFCTSDCPAE